MNCEADMQQANDPNFMMSLARGLAVIGAFPQERSEVSVSQLSRKTGISRAAVRRCLMTLVTLGYVEADASRFMLLPQVLSLGRTYLSPLGMAQPILDKLNASTGAICSLATLAWDDIVVVASSAHRADDDICVRVGGRMPSYRTAMGRILLAGMPAPSREALIDRLQLAPLNINTSVTRENLVAAVETARISKFAIVDQEFKEGVRSIAVPAGDGRDSPALALGMTFPTRRAAISLLRSKFLGMARDAALEVGDLIGRANASASRQEDFRATQHRVSGVVIPGVFVQDLVSTVPVATKPL